MRKYRLRVGLDVDDVLYECNQYALTLLKEKYGPLPELDINAIRGWGVQGTRADERFSMFATPSFVASQPLCRGAKKFVHELSKIADVFFITAVPTACMSARAERLVRDFPEVPASNILIGARKDLVHPDILLDDGAHNIASSGASYPVLLRRPWNTHLSGLLAVNSYDDFLHLTKMVRNSFVEKKPDLSRGGVLCLVGATGTGKTQITTALTSCGHFEKPVTSTTRPRRPGEAKDAYRFIDEETFICNRDDGRYLETTVYGGYYFGTSEDEINSIVDRGKIAVIPIDICGALTLKNVYRNRAMLIYTDRSRGAILRDILARPVSDEDKVNRILSLDYEYRNAELCDAAVNYDAGVDACVEGILRALGKDAKEKADDDGTLY